MKKNNKKNNKALKVGIFCFLTLCVASLCIVIFSSSKIDDLEGYMYDALLSLTSATSSNATSCNATSCNATSSNATSNNANKNSNNQNNNTVVNNKKEEVKVEQKEEVKDEKKVEEKTDKKETRNVSYDNENITTEILNQIKTTDEITSVTINAKNNSVIKKEVFSAIKGLDKNLIINTNNDVQITMNGKDIKEVKDIDVNINYTKLSSDVDLKEYADEAVVLNFKPNGILPATAKIKIKMTNEIKETLSGKKSVYIYYYNEKTRNIEEIATNVKIQDDSFEFTIKHNSKYIISSTKIENADKVEASNENNKNVSFLESKKMYILIIGVALIVIILVLIIVIVDRKKKANKMMENGKVRKAKANINEENDLNEGNDEKEENK